MNKGKTVKIISGGVSRFERSHDFGGVSEPSRSCPEVQTQSSEDLYRYTDLAMTADCPEWPKGPQVHACLRSYVKKDKPGHLFRLNTTV